MEKDKQITIKKYITMSPKEKAKELVDKYEKLMKSHFYKRQCALITIENEYRSNRELLFNLKASGIDISEKVYLSRLQGLIDEEKEVKHELEKL